MSVFWWMGLDLISLEGTAVSRSDFWGAFGFGMGLGSLPANILSCVLFCWRIGVRRPALELAGSWVELGLSVGMEAFGWALIY